MTGFIPAADLENIRQKAAFEVKRINEIESEVQHDVIAFLTNLAEHIGPSSRFVHFGLTSSDIGDTALSFTLQEAGQLLLHALKKLLQVLYHQACTYKDLTVAGRTHGVHAEPTTLGLKLLGYYEETGRNYTRLKNALAECAFGKISGAVGTYSQLPPQLEDYVLTKMGLSVEPVSTQVVPRDRHAVLLNAIAVTAQGLARLAQEIRLLQKTESREVEEPFQKGQKGSSAMPHKRNPILCERICGLARVLQGYAVSAQQDITLCHERDISHSSAERIIFPDAMSLLEYMILKMSFIMENLHVYPEQCEKILNLTGGLLFSSRVLLELTDNLKISREQAYAIVQKEAMDTWNQSGHPGLKERLMRHEQLSAIPAARWQEIFEPANFLKNIELIFKRVKNLRLIDARGDDGNGTSRTPRRDFECLVRDEPADPDAHAESDNDERRFCGAIRAVPQKEFMNNGGFPVERRFARKIERIASRTGCRCPRHWFGESPLPGKRLKRIAAQIIILIGRWN